MNKQAIINLIKFVSFNCLFIWCLIEATSGNNGAKNLLVFYVWFSAICYLIVIASQKTEKVKENAPSNFIIKSGLVINLLSIAWLVWSGWIFTAIAILLIAFGKVVIFGKKDNK